MKRRTILKLWQALGNLEGLKHDVRFSYFIAKNKVSIKSEIEALDEAQKPTETYLKYETERVELAKEFSDKDENGDPKVKNGQFIILGARDKFEDYIQKLKEAFKATISEREKQLKDYESLLDEDIETILTKIRFTQLPNQIEAAYLEIFIEADVINDDQNLEVVK